MYLKVYLYWGIKSYVEGVVRYMRKRNVWYLENVVIGVMEWIIIKNVVD